MLPSDGFPKPENRHCFYLSIYLSIYLSTSLPPPPAPWVTISLVSAFMRLFLFCLLVYIILRFHV